MRGEAAATGNLGVVVLDLGRTVEARKHVEGALALSREIGNRRTEGYARRTAAGRSGATRNTKDRRDYRTTWISVSFGQTRTRLCSRSWPKTGCSSR